MENEPLVQDQPSSQESKRFNNKSASILGLFLAIALGFIGYLIWQNFQLKQLVVSQSQTTSSLQGEVTQNEFVLGSGPDYSSCDGRSFTTECSQESCVNSGLERRVFDLWKKKIKQVYYMSDEEFNTNILIQNVELSEGSKEVWVRIEYLLQIDWIKSRQSASIEIGDYPLTSQPSDSYILSSISVRMRKDQDYTSKGTGIVSLDELRNLTRIKYNEIPIEYDYCHIGFAGNSARTLSLPGNAYVNLDENVCISAKIDLYLGELTFSEGPCVIF